MAVKSPGAEFNPLTIEMFTRRANPNVPASAPFFSDRFGHKALVNPLKRSNGFILFIVICVEFR